MKKMTAAMLLIILTVILGACGQTEIQDIPATVPQTEAVQTETVPEETQEREIPELTIPEAMRNQPAGETGIPKYALPDGFTHEEDTVYARYELMLRTTTSNWANCPGRLKKGEEVHRIGTRTDGWSAIYYNDHVYYIMTKHLSSKPPYMDPAETVGSATEAVGEAAPAPQTKK